MTFEFERHSKNEYILVTFEYAAYVVRKPPTSIMILYPLDKKKIQALYYRQVPGGDVKILDAPEVLERFAPFIQTSLEASPDLWPQLHALLEEMNRPHTN